MKFTGDDFQARPGSNHGSDITGTIEKEHSKQLLIVAGQRIKAMHQHDDGTPVQLHEVSTDEFFSGTSLEGKIDIGSEKMQLERNSKPGGLTYGRDTTKFDNAAFASQTKGQETLMMGCNCGLEWTVTGVSMKKDSSDTGPGAIKIEQYGSADWKVAGYNVSGPGGERQKYNVPGPPQQDYKG